MTTNNLYDRDYQQWAEHQKQLLKHGRFDELDIDNLLEELGEVGKSNRSALTSYFKTLLVHLLKYDYQTARLNPDLPLPYNCAEWMGTIRRCRDDIHHLIIESPSLKAYLPESLDRLYQQARKGAAKELEPYLQKHQAITFNDFPDTCPWTFEQIMKEGWLP